MNEEGGTYKNSYRRKDSGKGIEMRVIRKPENTSSGKGISLSEKETVAPSRSLGGLHGPFLITARATGRGGDGQSCHGS